MRRVPAVLVLLSILPVATLAQTADPYLRIEGRDSITEGSLITFSAFAFNPAGGVIRFSWDFGDGSGVLSGENLTGVSHRFRTDGTYRVRVDATGEGGYDLSRSIGVKVRNRDPRITELTGRLSYTRADTWDFRSVANDKGDDRLTYRWDFGDGTEIVSGVDLTETSHTYEVAGFYTVKLTVDDGDGGTNEKTMEVAIGQSRWKATVSGTMSELLSGEVKPLKSLWITPIDDVCRMTVTMWDDAAQAYLTMIIDPPSFSKGFTYTPSRSASLYFVADPAPANQYASTKQRLSSPMDLSVGAGILSAVKAVGGEAAASDLERHVGHDLGVNPFRSNARPPEPRARRPMAGNAEEAIRFQAVGGEMDFSVQPYNWIESKFRLEMENLDEDSPYRNVSLDGKFFINLADAQTEGMMRAPACDEKGPFRVEFAAPEPETIFVRQETVRVWVSFNEPYQTASVNGATFELFRQDGDQLISVEGTILHFPDQPDRFNFLPKKQIEAGFYYTAHLEGGREGVRSVQGEPLEEDYEWRFLVMPYVVSKDSREPNDSALSPRSIGESSPPNVSCSVYQSVRDAPLIEDKPTLIRVWATWKDDDVESFPATVVIEDANGNELFKRKHDFVHPKHYEEYGIDLAKAENSANFFGWRPSRDNGSPITARVRIPVSLSPAAGTESTRGSTEFRGQCSVEYWNEKPTLSVDYWFLEVGSWALGVPVEDWKYGQQHVRFNEAFAGEVFPISSMRARSRGSFSFGFLENVETEKRLLGARFDDYRLVNGAAFRIVGKEGSGRLNLLENHALETRREELLKAFHDSVSSQSSADVIVGLVPATVRSGGGARYDGYALTRIKGFRYPRRTVLLGVREDTVRTTALTHELGHLYNLEHLPDVKDAADRAVRCAQQTGRYEGIDGYRIRSGGTWGFNKSSREGNEESSLLRPLMFPCAQTMTDTFITRDQYLKMMTEMGRARRSGGLGASARRGAEREFEYARRTNRTPLYMFASLQDDPPPAPKRERLLVRGFVDVEQGFIALLPPIRTSKSEPSAVEGPFSLIVRDESGRTMHSLRFGPSPSRGPREDELDPETGGWEYFGFTLENPGEIASLGFGVGDETIHTLNRSAQPPAVSILAPGRGASINDKFDLSWTGSDPDGDELVYSISYSPDGGESWSLLASDLRETTKEIDPSSLPVGEAPVFRVSAKDWFHEASATVAVRMTRSLSVVAHWPAGEEVAGPNQEIWVAFNAPVEDAEDALELIDGRGARVPARSRVDVDGMETWLSPESPLEKGATYTVRLRDGIRDRFGNRPGKGSSFQFTVAPDQRPPIIRDHAPRNGALSVPSGAVIRVEFSEPIDPSTLRSGWIGLTGPGGSIPGSTRWDDETMTAVFTPRAPLARSSTYRVEVGRMPKDAAGNELAAPRSWTFTTISAAFAE